MGDQNPTLNVDDRRRKYYRIFIAGLRRAFANPGSFAHNVPVLPPQDHPPQGPGDWIDIVLCTSNVRLRLRLRRNNLYLDGFRNDADGSQWFEFSPDRGDQHLIPESTFLGFTSGYGAMGRVGPGDRDNVALGRMPLSNAVRQLSQLTNPLTAPDRRETAASLLVVVQMTCEAIRFVEISDYLALLWGSGVRENPPQRILYLENNWATLCDAVLHAEQDPERPFSLPRPNLLSFVNVGQVAAVLGIILYRFIPPPARVIREIMDVPWGDYPQGRVLLEVFSVCIKRIDGEDPGDLYGTIHAFDGMGYLDLYNRDRSSCESIRPGENATLTGPSRSVLATDGFTLDLKLSDKDIFPFSDDNIVNEKIFWNAFDLGNKYNEPIHGQVKGEYGSATVNYIVLNNAAQALVEVILINGDDEDPAVVYGTITANNGFGEIDLFRMDSANGIASVRPNAAIPLLRSTMAVPLNQEFVIEASLYDYDPVSPKDEIANGSAQFNVDILKSAQSSIRGKYGEISVRVSWF